MRKGRALLRLLLALALTGHGCGGAGQAPGPLPDVSRVDGGDAGDSGESSGGAELWSPPEGFVLPASPALPAAPAQPTLPEAPRLPGCMDEPSGCVRLGSWACAGGWELVAHETLTSEDGEPFSWCEPPIVPADTGCEPGSMPLIGHGGCVPMGPSCPEGSFAPVPEAAEQPVIFVRSGAPPGGDGSRGRPHDRIRDALRDGRILYHAAG